MTGKVAGVRERKRQVPPLHLPPAFPDEAASGRDERENCPAPFTPCRANGRMSFRRDASYPTLSKTPVTPSPVAPGEGPDQP